MREGRGSTSGVIDGRRYWKTADCGGFPGVDVWKWNPPGPDGEGSEAQGRFFIGRSGTWYECDRIAPPSWAPPSIHYGYEVTEESKRRQAEEAKGKEDAMSEVDRRIEVLVYGLPDRCVSVAALAVALGDLGSGAQVRVLVDAAGNGAAILKEFQQHGLNAEALRKVPVLRDGANNTDLTSAMSQLVNVLAELTPEKRNRVINAARVLLEEPPEQKAQWKTEPINWGLHLAAPQPPPGVR